MSDSCSGRLVIVSGPSGAGKSTVLGEVLRDAPVPITASVSATTRAARPGEVDGVNYHFLSKEEFAARRERNEFIECFEVFNGGDWYGTLASEVIPKLEQGESVVLEIDVNGALAVMEQFPEAVSIFVRPGSIKELETRLRGRGTETESAVTRRLAQAREELAVADRYRYQVVNDELQDAVDEIRAILVSETQVSS